ncbi:MAG: radical SAM/SPASM domain-containing protein [Fusobacteriaceae bacterium]
MKKFKKVYIEITNVCNLTCSFCPVTKRVQKFMSVQDFEMILNKIKNFTDYIYLHVKGEPLMHKNFSELLQIASKNNFFVNLTTNGTLIKNHAETLCEDFAPRQINFSLHSFDNNLNIIENENYLENIFEFTKKSLEKKLSFISLRLWNENPEKFSEIKKIGNKIIFEKIEKYFELDFKISEKLWEDFGSNKKSIKLRENLFVNFDEEFTWSEISKKNSDKYETGFCYGLRDQIAILVDGTVVPCCLDGEGVINLGNIFESSLDEILLTQRAISIHENFSNNKVVEELCKNCSYRERF